MNGLTQIDDLQPEPTYDHEPTTATEQIVAGDDANKSPTDTEHATSPIKYFSTEALRVGSHLAQDVFNINGVLLIAAGQQVTPRLLHHLRHRNIQTITIGHKKPQKYAQTNDNIDTQQLDAILEKAIEQFIPAQSEPPPRYANLSLADLNNEAAKGCERHAEATGLLTDLCETLSAGHSASGSEIRRMVRQFNETVMLDMDLLPLVVSMQSPEQEYLFSHCVSTAMLSVMIGAQLGFDREQVTEVGLGAMFQDVGMLQVPEDIRLAPRPLQPNEWFEIQQHPIYTLNQLERLDSISVAARFVGYQVHERADGSGYPRHRSGMFIHQCAKIVAVADAYAAMTKARPHRHPVLPYEAAKTILFEGSRGKLDRTVVRAFLDCVSLFPIGSGVQLSNGQQARVIRACPGQHTKPVVELLSREGQPTTQLVDLATDDSLKVISAFTYIEP